MNTQDQFNKAIEYKKQGKLKEALDLYRELQNELIDEAGEYARGIPETRIDEGSTRKIMPKLFLEVDSYLKRNIIYATILNNMGVIYTEAGDKKSAENCFKEAIMYTPDGFDYSDPKTGLEQIVEGTSDNSKQKMINLDQLNKDIGEKLQGERCMVEKTTPCALCGNTIKDNAILAVDRFFCSEYCRLKFWKEENTGLGGDWITDENLSDMKNLVGEERKKEYDRIVDFIVGNIGATALMLRFRADPKEYSGN